MTDQSLATADREEHHAGIMVTGPQIRAARALLGWSANELARHAKLSYPTVQRAESADGVPQMKTQSLFAIQRALEDGGVIFLDVGQQTDGGVGVRLRRSPGR